MKTNKKDIIISISILILILSTILSLNLNIESKKLQASAVNAIKMNNTDYKLKAVVMETPKSAMQRIEVYEGMTLEELSTKLNRSLGNDILSGKGEFIASKTISLGMDPYLTASIMLHETGCGSKCSYLARACNNFGGQKGAPGCNGGAYKMFNSVEEGLDGMISNLYRNYYVQGLTDVYSIGRKYAEGASWPSKINWYINKLRNA